MIALAVAAVIIGGCARGGSVDKVTVTAGDSVVTLPAALSCYAPPGSSEMTCAGGENDDAAPHLAVSPGAAVEVAVPAAVGDTPWVIVFTSIDQDGTQNSDRTAVFPPKERFSYTLEPGPGVQLTRLEVQSLTAAPAADGGVEFPAIGTWVLIIDVPAAEPLGS